MNLVQLIQLGVIWGTVFGVVFSIAILEADDSLPWILQGKTLKFGFDPLDVPRNQSSLAGMPVNCVTPANKTLPCLD
jgi:hypothetical protein